MILYNITINIEKEVEEEWFVWMKQIHIPAILDTGLVKDNKILKLLTEIDESMGITYSFQYFLPDRTSLEKFQNEYEPLIDSTLYKKYQNKFVEFRTVLEVMD